jgi:tagaturonate epimerase
MKLPRFTFGVGDRFGHQGKAQLLAMQKAAEHGIPVSPVWNKSNREHNLIGTEPSSLRAEADEAVIALGWKEPYFVDADHINLKTVDRFLEASDFFTIDVADSIGKTPDPAAEQRLVDKHAGKPLEYPGLSAPILRGEDEVRSAAAKFLCAMQEAGEVYSHIASRKPAGSFAVEVSTDEASDPQTPGELYLILAMLSDEGVPVATIAPKFTGQFNKGVDYEGIVADFAREFEDDLIVLKHAGPELGLPEGLKLSVHSGSDKFSIYPVINGLVKKHGAGLHLKTAGTTWLEEIAAVADSSEAGRALAARIYGDALARYEEVTAPYATVLHIDRSKLPPAAEVASWDGSRLARAILHEQSCTDYDPNVRQLYHVAFKLAAEAGQEYLGLLETHAEEVGAAVTANLWERHLKPLFL